MAALLLSAFLCGTSSVAFAHLGHVVMRAERYLKVDVAPEEVRIVVSLSLGPSEMLRIMTDADANEDGEVSPQESEVYLVAWGEGLATELPVAVDGQAQALEWGEGYFDPRGPVQPQMGAVEMVAHLRLEPGEHVVTLQDRMRVETFERTDVVFRDESGGDLRGCAMSVEVGTECEGAFAYDAENVPDAIGARVFVEGWTTREYAFAGGALLAMLLVAALSWLRIRRRSAP